LFTFLMCYHVTVQMLSEVALLRTFRALFLFLSTCECGIWRQLFHHRLFYECHK